MELNETKAIVGVPRPGSYCIIIFPMHTQY